MVYSSEGIIWQLCSKSTSFHIKVFFKATQIKNGARLQVLVTVSWLTVQHGASCVYCQLRTIKANLKDHAYVATMQFDIAVWLTAPHWQICSYPCSDIISLRFIASSSAPTIFITYSAVTMLCRVGHYQHCMGLLTYWSKVWIVTLTKICGAVIVKLVRYL